MSVLELEEASELAEVEPPVRRRSITRGMVLVLAAQWSVLTAWCWHLYTNFNVHVDFAALTMFWWALLHGSYNPHITVWNHTFLADHFELISYPLGYLTYLWPHFFWGFMLQNGFIVLGEVGALLLVDLYTSRPWWPAAIAKSTALWLTLGLFVLNPWIFWAVSDDVHFHAIGLAAAAVLVLYCAVAEKWWWLAAATALCLSTSDLAGPFVLGIAAAVLLVGWRKWSGRIASASLAVTGLVWIKFVKMMGGDQGSNLKLHFGYLLGHGAKKDSSLAVLLAVAKHPEEVATHLFHALGSLWGYVSAGGVFGLFNPLAAPAWLALAEGGLGRAAGVTYGTVSMSPWQMAGATLFIGPMSVIALAWLMSRTWKPAAWLLRHRRLVIGVMLVNALVWTAIWIPVEISDMDLTPAATAAALDHVVTMIPSNNEVVASWGVLGRFGNRRYLHTFPIKLRVDETLKVQLDTKHVDFVVTPWTGLEHEGPNPLGVLAALVEDPKAVILYHKAQVWLIEYTRAPGQTSMKLNVSYVGLPGTVLPYPLSHHPKYGWPNADCMYSNSLRAGYLESRLTQHLKVGAYELVLSVDSKMPLAVEVLDDDTKVLLARDYYQVQKGLHNLIVPFNVTSANLHNEPLFKGWGPYRFAQLPPLPQDTIEFRLWSRGGGLRSVCSASLFQASAPGTASSASTSAY